MEPLEILVLSVVLRCQGEIVNYLVPELVDIDFQFDEFNQLLFHGTV
jgi:hypothetical protein